MLAWLGFGMVTTFMTLIMTRRLSPLVALISVPIVFALLGGFGGAELGTMMLSGLRTLAGVMNLTPWGGPLARAASALHVEPADVFVPMLPAMAMGIAAVFGLTWLLGRREKERLGRLSLSAAATDVTPIADSALVPAESNADVLRRPKLLAINAILTLLLLVALVLGVLPLPVLFMIAFGSHC